MVRLFFNIWPFGNNENQPNYVTSLPKQAQDFAKQEINRQTFVKDLLTSPNLVTTIPKFKLISEIGAVQFKIIRLSVKKCRRDCTCIENLPVCGSNNVTYLDLCHLDNAACNDRSIVFKSSGKCGKEPMTCKKNRSLQRQWLWLSWQSGRF